MDHELLSVSKMTTKLLVEVLSGDGDLDGGTHRAGTGNGPHKFCRGGMCLAGLWES